MNNSRIQTSPITIILICWHCSYTCYCCCGRCLPLLCLFVLFGTTYWVNPNLYAYYPPPQSPNIPSEKRLYLCICIRTMPMCISSRQAKCQWCVLDGQINAAGSGLSNSNCNEIECESESEYKFIGGGTGSTALTHLRRQRGLAPAGVVLRWQSQRRVKVPRLR